MRNVKSTGLALALGLLSFSSFSAEQINTRSADPAQAVAVSARPVLSSSAPGNMNGMNEKLVPDGTRSYPMTSVSGQHNMHSTSVVYE